MSVVHFAGPLCGTAADIGPRTSGAAEYLRVLIYAPSTYSKLDNYVKKTRLGSCRHSISTVANSLNLCMFPTLSLPGAKKSLRRSLFLTR
jgi:hypothetical protein